MKLALVVAPLASLASLAVAACSPDPACLVDGDCAVGETCSAAQTCVASGGDAGASDGGGPIGDGAAVCTPNNDGVITRDELPVVVPSSTKFRTSGQTAIDLTGTTGSDGLRHWDYSGAMAGDTDVTLATAPVAGTWFASDFSTGQFTTPTTFDGESLLAIYSADGSGVSLLGVASPSASSTQTELTYAPPLRVFQTPMQNGGSWSANSTVTGTLEGVAGVIYVDWRQTVDARGVVATPYGEFPVLRVRLDTTTLAGALETTEIAYSFVAECYGAVANVTSRTDETTEEFTTAASAARLAP